MIRIIENPHMTIPEQYKFPRSKKARMRRKFAKRYTRQVPDPDVFVVGNNKFVGFGAQMIVAHPVTAQKLRELIRAPEKYKVREDIGIGPLGALLLKSPNQGIYSVMACA